MRSIHGLLAVVVVCGAAGMAAGGNSYWGDAMGCGGCGAYAAPACAAPSYGLVPGCCEFPPSCCYHVWDGYCQERAYWLARCCGAGACGYGAAPFGGVGPGCPACQTEVPAVEPTPDAPPAPPAEPAPPDPAYETPPAKK